MTFTITANQQPSTPGHAVWMLKEALVAAGWSVPRSGTGTAGTYSSGGDAHDPGGPYAGTMDDKNLAWFELRQPASAAVRRSFLFQLVAAGTAQWRIWYSSNGTGFTGGTPSTSARGTAADEQGLTNTPTGTTEWLRVPTAANGPGIGFVDIIAGNVAEEFSFFFGTRSAIEADSGFQGYEAALTLDVLTGAQGADADPAIVGTHFVGDANRLALQSAGGLLGEMVATQTQGCSRGWYKKGLGGAAFTMFPPCVWGCNEGSVGSTEPLCDDRTSAGADAESFQTLPVIYWRGGTTHATLRGFKGKSRLFMTAQRRFGGLRLNQDRSRLAVGMLSLPWDGVTIPTF